MGRDARACSVIFFTNPARRRAEIFRIRRTIRYNSAFRVTKPFGGFTVGGCLTFHYDVGRSGTGPGAAGGWHRYNQVDNLGRAGTGSAVRGAPLYLPGW